MDFRIETLRFMCWRKFRTRCIFETFFYYYTIKGTDRENTPSNKTEALVKSVNLHIWAIGILNQLFIKDSSTQIKFSKKWSPFCTPHSIFYGNVALSFVVLWAKKQYSSFLRKVLAFRKTCFKVKVLKTFKIPSDCHIKAFRSLKRRAILKIPSNS